MRTPLVKRQTTPMSGFFLFFRFPGSSVVSSRSCALTSFPSLGAHPGGCTKHLLRFYHHMRDNCRAAWRLSSAT